MYSHNLMNANNENYEFQVEDFHNWLIRVNETLIFSDFDSFIFILKKYYKLKKSQFILDEIRLFGW